MSFLNNAGTIKIDAILTDVGRRRLAQGKFEISGFCLGDDEIDYTLFDVDNDDGTKLKTTPTLEALNANNATIIHGLEHYGSDDIWYIPQIKINNLIKDSVTTKNTAPHSQFYYVSVNQETTNKLKNILNKKQFLENNTYDKNKLVFESGIEPPGVSRSTSTPAEQIPRTQTSRERYILNYNLLDNNTVRDYYLQIIKTISLIIRTFLKKLKSLIQNLVLQDKFLLLML